MWLGLQNVGMTSHLLGLKEASKAEMTSLLSLGRSEGRLASTGNPPPLFPDHFACGRLYELCQSIYKNPYFHFGN